MLEWLNDYFQELTQENWGLPWHAVIVLVGMPVAVIAAMYAGLPLNAAVGISFAGFAIVGFLYGARQYGKARDLEVNRELQGERVEKRAKKDFLQDFAAEFISLCISSGTIAMLERMLVG